MKRLLQVTALLLAASAGPLDGQTLQDLPPETMVRLTRPDTAGVEQSSVLRLQRVAPDSLFLVRRIGKHRIKEAVALADVTRLELQTGSERHPWIGMAAGLVVGGLIALGASDDTGSTMIGSKKSWNQGTAMVGGPLVGLVLGLLVTTPTWEEVRLPPAGQSVE